MRKFIFLFLLFGLTFAGSVLAQEKTEIYFFSSKTCPHCAQEREFLAELQQKYPEVEVKEYEVIYNTDNQKILKEFYDKYSVPQGEQGWVPVTFTPTDYFVGFSEETAKEIESCLASCLKGEERTAGEVVLPFFGKVDTAKMSLPLLTIVFGALDGFNPCAMWVLLFLIVLLINTHSRKRLWIVGGTFILVSGIVYYLILAAWFNLFLAIAYVNITRIAIGIVAVGVGIWQLREFVYYRTGVCKVSDGKTTIQERIKDGLKSRAEKLALSPLTLGMVFGVAVLALGVNLVEFFCSAGLPAIYTRILALQNVQPLFHYLYLLLYTFVFMLDDIIIFVLAAFTLSRFGFSEKYNYWTTLFGGLIILILGLLLIFRPELLTFM